MSVEARAERYSSSESSPEARDTQCPSRNHDRRTHRIIRPSLRTSRGFPALRLMPCARRFKSFQQLDCGDVVGVPFFRRSDADILVRYPVVQRNMRSFRIIFIARRNIGALALDVALLYSFAFFSGYICLLLYFSAITFATSAYENEAFTSAFSTLTFLPS